MFVKVYRYHSVMKNISNNREKSVISFWKSFDKSEAFPFLKLHRNIKIYKTKKVNDFLLFSLFDVLDKKKGF